ncbi:MAG: hypothetical protein KGS00_14750, partial [Alphaproteobacteria bacterium]|nr:hypothetical protein [Alphaproteobacteria bacterium]
NREPGRIPVEQQQGAHHRMTDNHIATLVFLEGVGPSTDQTASIILGEVQALHDPVPPKRSLMTSRSSP